MPAAARCLLLRQVEFSGQEDCAIGEVSFRARGEVRFPLRSRDASTSPIMPMQDAGNPDSAAAVSASHSA
jgi:hypothetical protein